MDGEIQDKQWAWPPTLWRATQQGLGSSQQGLGPSHPLAAGNIEGMETLKL